MTKQEILLLSNLLYWNIEVIKARQASSGKTLTHDLRQQIDALNKLMVVWLDPDSSSPEDHASLRDIQILARTYAEFQLLRPS